MGGVPPQEAAGDEFAPLQATRTLHKIFCFIGWHPLA